MKKLFFLSVALVLTTAAFATGTAHKVKKDPPPSPGGGGDTEQDKARQTSQGQLLIFDLTRLGNKVDSTATIGTFGGARHLGKISPDMFGRQNGL